MATLIRLYRHQFSRFLAVGLLNTLFGYGCFALLLYLGLHYAWALLFATVAGVLFNFKTVGGIVFRSKDNRLIVRFVAVYAVVYVVNLMGLKALSIAGIDMYYGAAALILPMAMLAYLMNKRFVFQNAETH